MAWKRTYTTFTASEAERITGIDKVRQRDMRRHGYLPPLEGGKAAFEAPMLAGMIAAAALAKAGIPPANGWQLARSCGTVIVARALNARRGVLDPDGLLDEDLIKVGGPLPVYAVTGDARSWGWILPGEDITPHLDLVSVVINLAKASDQLVERARKPLVVIVQEGHQNAA